MRNIKFFLRTATVVVFAALANSANAQSTFRPCPVYLALGTGATFGEIQEIINDEFAAGRNPNAPTYYGGTPMHYAARHNRADVMDLLESRGADVNTADDRDLTPFMVAVLAGAQNAALTLADMGAVVHARDANNYTPMHAAIMTRRTVMVSVIADEIQAANRPGYFIAPGGDTVWHFAAAQITSAALLTQIFNAVGSPISSGDDFADRSAGQRQIAAQNDQGATPLMTSIHHSNYTTFTFIFNFLFIHNPVALGVADEDGRTAYMMSNYRNSPQIAATLFSEYVQSGDESDLAAININAVDNAGNDWQYYFLARIGGLENQTAAVAIFNPRPIPTARCPALISISGERRNLCTARRILIREKDRAFAR